MQIIYSPVYSFFRDNIANLLEIHACSNPSPYSQTYVTFQHEVLQLY